RLAARAAPAAAEVALAEALRLDETLAEAHCMLGRALAERGRFSEAAEALRRGHELGSRRPGWPLPSGRWLAEACRRAAVEGRLAQAGRGGGAARAPPRPAPGAGGPARGGAAPGAPRGPRGEGRGGGRRPL